MPRCENEIRTSGPVDNSSEFCNRHAIAICLLCGNSLCARCMDACYECNGVFCEGHLEEHAEDTGHNPYCPDRITCTAAYGSAPAIVAGFRRMS